MDAWRRSLEALEETWLEPGLAALGHGDIDALTLLADTGAGRVLGRRSLRRFWRSSRPLPELLAAMTGPLAT